MRRSTYATTTEAAMRKAVADGLSWAEMARRDSLNPFALRAAAALLGIRAACYTANSPPKARLNEWLAKLEDGHSIRSIAEASGITFGALRMALKRAGLPTTASAAMLAKLRRLKGHA